MLVKQFKLSYLDWPGALGCVHDNTWESVAMTAGGVGKYFHIAEVAFLRNAVGMALVAVPRGRVNFNPTR